MMWLVTVEHVVGNRGWIHPADRGTERIKVKLPGTVRNADTAAHRLEVTRLCHHNPIFKSRIRTVEALKDVIA